jgi:hypothetical protein
VSELFEVTAFLLDNLRASCPFSAGLTSILEELYRPRSHHNSAQPLEFVFSAAPGDHTAAQKRGAKDIRSDMQHTRETRNAYKFLVGTLEKSSRESSRRIWDNSKSIFKGNCFYLAFTWLKNFF